MPGSITEEEEEASESETEEGDAEAMPVRAGGINWVYLYPGTVTT